MKNTLVALALVKSLWDASRKDYLDAFLPLLALALQRRKISEFRDLRPIQQHFLDDWGLAIPYQAVAAIVNRARKRGLLTRSAGMYYPVLARLRAECSEASADDRRKRIAAMLSSYSQFAAGHNVELDAAKAETALISYLRRNSSNLHLIAGTTSPLPDLRTTDQALYLFARFATEAQASNSADFRTLVEVWFGHALVNAVVFPDIESLKGKLTKLTLYLDAPFVFGALGYSGSEAQDAALELLRAAKSNGAHLGLFHHTYDEVYGILESTVPWLTNLREYDPSRASLTLRHFMDVGLTPSDVEQILSSLPSRLDSLGIKLEASPPAVENIRYQIDEMRLEEIIREIYRFTPTDYTIQRDIASIAAIYHLRRDHIPRRINETKYLFLTPNHSLALSSRRYESQYISDTFFIPAAITDVLLGTIIWLESPQSLEELSRLQLISDVQGLLEPREVLLRRFVQAVQDLAQRGQITADEYVLLRTSQVARSLLQDLTLGDPENFSHSTPEEILNHIKDSVRGEERAAAAARENVLRERFLTEQEGRLAAMAETGKIDTHLNKICDRIGLGVAVAAFVLLAAAWFGIFAWVTGATNATGWKKAVALVATVLLSVGTLIVPVVDALSLSSKLRAGIAHFLKRKVFSR